MCLKHEEFRKHLTGTKFEGLCAVIVDEMHCISQWGGDFRKAYAELSKLRAFFPPHIPILGTSATVPPPALLEVRASLLVDAETSFFLNLGNDRPNISFEVHQLNSASDFDSLRPYLTRVPNASSPDDIIKSIVFTNSVISTQLGAAKFRSWLPRHLRKQVDYLHALRTPRARKRVMKRFRKGKIKILVATEAAGMV
jgi:bloom syndrome protein